MFSTDDFRPKHSLSVTKRLLFLSSERIAGNTEVISSLGYFLIDGTAGTQVSDG